MSKEKKEKASERAERLLIEGIFDGTYPLGSELPGERDLSKKLGVARPALREALQRLSRDGWVDIQQGKSTAVNHFMREGNLNVLIGLLQADISHLSDFIPNLLEIWSLMAPFYTRVAIERAPKDIYQKLYGYRGLADRAYPYARAQWRLHRTLIERSGNPVYGLILNSFYEFFAPLSLAYHDDPATRAEARVFWETLYSAALTGDSEKGAEAMWKHMQQVLDDWLKLDFSLLKMDEPDEN